jgi:hypothetical protein
MRKEVEKIYTAVRGFQETLLKEEAFLLVIRSEEKVNFALSGVKADVLASLMMAMAEKDDFEELIRETVFYYDKFEKQKRLQKETQRPAEKDKPLDETFDA